MNKYQRICMYIGLMAILGFWQYAYESRNLLLGFSGKDCIYGTIGIALLTLGLMYSLKSKKQQATEHKADKEQ